MSFNPFSSRSADGAVDGILGEAYKVVKKTHDKLPEIEEAIEFLNRDYTAEIAGASAEADRATNQANIATSQVALATAEFYRAQGEADRAEAQADIAAGHAAYTGSQIAYAESMTGPTYASTAAGLAATTDGQAFAVDNGDGTVTVYLNVSGAAVEQRRLFTTDFAASSAGAGGVGVTGGGTVQSSLDTLTTATSAAQADAVASALKTRQSIAREQLSWLPFEAVSDVYVGDLIPTASTPVAAKRLHSEWILVRVRTTGLDAATAQSTFFNEYLYRDPAGYAEVAGGWQLVMVRAYVNGYYTNIFTSPDDPGKMPNADFAVRIGLMSDAYVSSGDTGDWRFRGFGHGGMLNTPANNQITSDGAAGNLQPTANWAVGATAYGTLFTINCNYGIVLPPKTLGTNPASTDGSTGTVTITYASHGMASGMRVKLTSITDTGGITQAQMTGVFTITVVDANTFTISTAGTSTSAATGGGSVGKIEIEAATFNYVLSHGASYGARRYLKQQYLTAFSPAVGFQDSYHVLFGVDPFEIDFFKPGGFNAEEILLDGTVKSDSAAWHVGAGNVYQAYSSFDTRLVFTVVDEYGQPIRASDGSVSAFEFNTFARRFFNDQPDYPKFYAMFASSAEGLPRVAQQVDKTIFYESQSTMAVTYSASGPV